MVLRLLAIVIERQVMFCSLGGGGLVRSEPIGKINSFACYRFEIIIPFPRGRILSSDILNVRDRNFLFSDAPPSPLVSLKPLRFEFFTLKSRWVGFRKRSIERCFSARESRNKFRFFFFFLPLFFFISAPRPARKKKTGFIGVTRGRLGFHRSGPMNEWMNGSTKEFTKTRVTNVRAASINLSPPKKEEAFAWLPRHCVAGSIRFVAKLRYE